MKIVGYGICGGGEADRYMRATLDEFKRLCDETIILLNNGTDKERALLDEYGFAYVEDDREWGKNQHYIKEDFIRHHVAELNPDATICLDMDETFANLDRAKLEEWVGRADACKVYVVNLWDDGYNKPWCFWNVRFWSWRLRDELGDRFFQFEARPLHCGLAPKWCYHLDMYAPVILLHYGLKDKADRLRKVERYKKYDPNRKYREPSYYAELEKGTAEPFNLPKMIEMVEEDVVLMEQPMNKKLVLPSQKNTVMIIWEADGMIEEIKPHLLPMKLQMKRLGKGCKEYTDPSKEKLEPKDKTIVSIGRHTHLWHEEGKARAFERLGYRVVRYEEAEFEKGFINEIIKIKPDFILFAKLRVSIAQLAMQEWKHAGITTVCWHPDLYFGLSREPLIGTQPMWQADFVFSPDGGNQERFKELGVNHHVLRQAIAEDDIEKVAIDPEQICDVLFVGSNSKVHGHRNAIIEELEKHYHVRWIGQDNSDEYRAKALSVAIQSAKIVLGDSVPSDYYWSNRIYETIGRYGFTIHSRIKGIEDEYKVGEHFDTYEIGNIKELKEKIDYWLPKEKERRQVAEQGADFTRQKHTLIERCKTLLDIIKQ